MALRAIAIAAEVPTRESLSYWEEADRIIEQFQAAGCIAEASN